MWDFFQCAFEAVVEKGLRGLAEFVPGGGVAFDVAKATFEKYRQRCKDDKKFKDIEDRMRQDMEQMAQAGVGEIKQAAAEIAKQAPAEIRPIIQVYLEQIPASVRRSLRRPDNPEGKRVPADFSLRSAEDVAELLPPTLPLFKPNDPLPGKPGWVLDRHLSGGGFGEVWLARHAQFGMTGAIKIFKNLQGRDRDLLHEANVIARLIGEGKHPNVVRLLDAHLDGDSPWLMYEYVEGGDLGDAIRAWEKLPPPERQKKAVNALQMLARAVGRFHRLTPPIVHRDLKPANILYDKIEKQLRITDFGIGGIAARDMIDGEKRGSLTRAGRLPSYLYGSYTPLYASPQQKTGDPPDPRDDVHALGVIAYQMLTCQINQGVGPDFAHDLQELAVEQGLIDLVGRCTSQKAERRPKDASEIAEALGRLVPASQAQSVGSSAAVAAPPAQGRNVDNSRAWNGYGAGSYALEPEVNRGRKQTENTVEAAKSAVDHHDLHTENAGEIDTIQEETQLFVHPSTYYPDRPSLLKGLLIGIAVTVVSCTTVCISSAVVVERAGNSLPSDTIMTLHAVAFILGMLGFIIVPSANYAIWGLRCNAAKRAHAEAAALLRANKK